MGFGQISLKGRALRFLAAREHSRLELERKLKAHAQTPDELADVLDDLERKGFIDAQRVIDSVLNQRAARWGASRVRQALQAKGLGGEAVQAAMASLKDSEEGRAQALWTRRFGTIATEMGERAKQTRFLLARGFSGEVVRRVLSGRVQAESEASASGATGGSRATLSDNGPSDLSTPFARHTDEH